MRAAKLLSLFPAVWAADFLYAWSAKTVFGHAWNDTAYWGTIMSTIALWGWRIGLFGTALAALGVVAWMGWRVLNTLRQPSPGSLYRESAQARTLERHPPRV